MQHLTLVALLALVATASAFHDLMQGDCRDNQKILLQQKKIDVEYKTLRVLEHVETILGDGNAKITCIEAVDYKQKETSATPHIVTGGLGQTHVTIKLISSRGHGIHYILKVYGKRF